MITEKCFSLIKEFEGKRLKPYLCPAGYWTIGYGHVLVKDEVTAFKDGITEEQAETLLYEDVYKTYFMIFPLVTVYLHHYCWDALVSFSFNVGVYAFRASSLRKKINRAEFYSAAEEFLKWVFAGGKKLKGLVRRRQQERDLFLEGVKLL
jgi:lysozyme